MTSNEIRQVVGMKPSEDPRADELRNKNLSAPSGSNQQSEEMPIAEVDSVGDSASDLDHDFISCKLVSDFSNVIDRNQFERVSEE